MLRRFHAPVFRAETRLAMELDCTERAVPIQFGHYQNEIGAVIRDQIPCVGGQLVSDRIDQSLRAVKPQSPLAPQQHPQQAIKAAEMVHVHMRYEDVAEPQKLARR